MLKHRARLDWALLCLLLAGAAALATWQDLFWRLDQAFYDRAVSWLAPSPRQDIVIVAIDEESLARIGRWPWRRAVHASLIERLRQSASKAVGMDILFSEPADSDADQLLAESLRRHGRVVLPLTLQNFGAGLLAEGRPIEPIATAAAALGQVETRLDTDGVARGVDLWAGLGGARHAQFALALLQVAEPSLAAPYALDQSALATAGWHGQQRLQLRFAGRAPGSMTRVSYVDVLTGAVPAAALRGKWVLVGATAAGLGDAYATPLAGDGRAMPGVELHAQVLQTLLDGQAYQPFSRSLAVGLAVVLSLALMLGLLKLSPRRGLLLSGLALLAVLLLSWGLLALGWWLPPSPLLMVAVLAYPLWSWRRLEAAQRFVDAELAQLRAESPALPAIPASDPLEQRLATLQAIGQQQRDARHAREETLRFISHDIRSPLASIITVAEAAEGDEPRLRQAGRYAQTALDLADDLLRLAQAESADPQRFELIDLLAVCQEALDDLWALAEAKHMSVDFNSEIEAEALVRGDSPLLRRALANLLGNAIKYSPAGSPVRVTLQAVQGGFEVAVVDQGEGIPAEVQPRLFTRFQRHSRSGVSGVGLGLVLVKTVAERHGGRVEVVSQFGQGSTFRVWLPGAVE